MPPKRSAAGGSGAAKKSRGAAAADSTNSAPPVPEVPRNKRWSTGISGSANADAEYKYAVMNPVEAYSFVCLCQPPFDNGEDSDDDEDDFETDEDDEEDDEEDGGEDEHAEKKKRVQCDGGKTCLCDKPASEHPDHIWQMSVAGKAKFFNQRVHSALRDPDSFGMYTFNDHSGYGVLEMLQNLILDYEEAADNYKEQWAVCEGLAFFLRTDTAGEVTQIDDGDTVDATYLLIGRLFMSMLARLERENLLTKDSEIKNLGLIMALFMTFGLLSRSYGLLERSTSESLGPAKDKLKWKPHEFNNQILAYARKHDIELVGPCDIEGAVVQAKANAPLPVPESNNTARADPFNFAKALTKYKKERGGITAMLAQGNGSSSSPIGGDNLDITTWSSAARKKKSFNNKDPLGKRELDALKEGMVMALA